jgi:transposase
MADSGGALVLLRHLPPAKRFLGDKAYNADWLRDGLRDRGIHACIPPREERRKPAKYNKSHYRKRYRIETASGRLRDWRGIATRYERCGDIFLNAITLAAIVILWI